MKKVFNAKERAKVLMKGTNPNTNKPRTKQERIDWINMLLRKNILMNHTREQWIEIKKQLK